MMDAQKATAGAVQSVEPAFDILEIMASAGGSTGVSELADLSIDCGARAADRGVLVSKGTLAPTRCRGIQAVGSGLSGQETAWEMAKCAAVACQAQGKAEPPGDRFEMAPAQFVNEWQQPLFAGHFDCWVAVGKPAQCVVPLVVGCEHRVPGPCDGGVDAHPGRQLVVGGLCPRIRRSLARGMASLGSPVPTIRTERKAESALIGWPFRAEKGTRQEHPAVAGIWRLRCGHRQASFAGRSYWRSPRSAAAQPKRRLSFMCRLTSL